MELKLLSKVKATTWKKSKHIASVFAQVTSQELCSGFTFDHTFKYVVDISDDDIFSLEGLQNIPSFRGSRFKITMWIPSGSMQTL